MRRRAVAEPAESDLDQSTRPRRPFGVIVLVIIQLGSILAISTLEFFRVQPPVQSVLELLEKYQLTSILSQAVGGLNSVLGVVLPPAWLGWLARGLILLGLLTAAGLWGMRRWAWVLLMMQVGLTMLLDLGLYFAGEPRFLSMLASVVLVFYLNQRDVQHAFIRRRATRMTEGT